jgi:hypothetical protein
MGFKQMLLEFVQAVSNMAALWILAISSQLLLVIKYSIALPSCSENVTKLQVCVIDPDFKGDFFLLCNRKKRWKQSK